MADRNVRAPLSLFFDDLLDAKVREFNPRYSEAEGVADIKELNKIVFQSKMEQEALKYLALVARNFNDKDVENLIEHFRDADRRKVFFKEFKEIEMLNEIISPDAFLRPFMDTYSTLLDKAGRL